MKGTIVADVGPPLEARQSIAAPPRNPRLSGRPRQMGADLSNQLVG